MIQNLPFPVAYKERKVFLPFVQRFCALLRELPAIVRRVAEAREKVRRPYKRFLQTYRGLGYQLMWDEELRLEIMEDGAEPWLSQVE